MDITRILLLLTVSLTITSCQKMTATEVASMMREILSPKNTEQAVQFIKSAANKIGTPEFTVNRRSVIQEAGLPRIVEYPLQANRRPVITETGVPGTVLRNEGVPNKIVPQKPNEMVMPRNVAMQNTAPKKAIAQKPNEFVMQRNVVMKQANEMPMQVFVQTQNDYNSPKNVITRSAIPTNLVPQMNVQMQKELKPNNVIVKKPELAIPKRVLVQNPEKAMPNRKILVQKGKEIPMLKSLVLNRNLPQQDAPTKIIVVQKSNDAPLRQTPKMRAVVEVIETPRLLLEQPRLVEYLPQEKVAVNSYLPAASPASGVLASTAPVLPQSRGQFLRKIPIPPPTI